MPKRLEGRVAAVTGAGRGVGRAIALGLASEGARVVVNDLGGKPDGVGASRQPADEVVREIARRGGSQAVASYESVADFTAAGHIIQTALDSFGRLDILVNCAGNQRHAPIYQVAEQDWDAVVAVHLKGTFNCIRHAVGPLMAQRSGRIVNIFSLSAFKGGPGHPSYAAAKAGIWGMSNMVSKELAPYGITVNVVSPGFTDTRLAARLVQEVREKGIAASAHGHMEGVQLGPVQPEEVAPLIVYLCTDEAASITGQTFMAYGPYISWYPVPEPGAVLYKEGRWTIDELVRYFPVVMRKAMGRGQG